MSGESKNCYPLIKRQINRVAVNKEDAMCKKTFNRSVTAVLTAAAVMVFGGLGARADIVPANCGGANASDLQLNANTGGPVQVGQVIEYQVVLINPQLTGGGQQNCRITNASASFRLPNGTQYPVLTNIALDPGQSIVCPGNALCLTNAFGPASFGYPYMVRAIDIVNIDPTLCPPPAGPIAAISARAFGAAVVLNGTVNGAKNYQPCANTSVNLPCISCTKVCTNAIGFNGQITFGGSILNCGNSVLVGVTASNLVGGVIVPVTLSTNTLIPGQSVTFSGSYANPNPCSSVTDTILVKGVDRDTAQVVTNSCVATCSNIFAPCIAVTKVCSTNLVFLCNSNPGSIGFSGIVSNCGTITLTNVVLTDDLTGGTVLTLGSLGVGATAPWSANFTVNPSLCGRSNIVNTVTAIGANLCNPAQTVTNRATCSFSVVCPAPSLTISKFCASPIVTNVGSSLTVTGQVCNTGTIDFTDVKVIDSQPGLPTAATNDLGTLAAGACKPYSFTYTATSCDPNHDVVTALGTSSCGTASNSASADCFLCCPGISIQKLVACLQPGATCPPSGASYGPTATGVKGNTGDPTQDDPAFCYIVVVRNTGHDPLTNIVIHDDKLGALGTFPGPLAVGGTITISNLRTNWATTTTNTATVTAQCGGVHANGAAVSATTNAVAVVIPANISCVKLASVNGSAPAAVFNATDCTSATNVVTWYAAVTNTGQATLCNIVIRELGTGPDLLPCGAVNVVLTNCLAPGQGTGLIPLCTSTYGCVDTNINNSIRVIGTVASISNVCAINITGSNIVAESECRASVTLCCTPPVLGCRVTGGGRQDDPEVCPADVRYVTHGGQVGAPVGNSNCVVTLDNIIGNPCIHGRWTHVRHTKGGLEGNFHARFYDTLDCACLATNLDATGLYSDGNVVDGTCNPGDRIAGPEPRRAPANKIVFTGVGDWADPNGRREPRSVLFRVDIEDRSEPGGFHPGGAKPPADRYRIRIWVLSDAELAKLNNPTDGLLAFRNCIAACHGLKYQDGVLASQIANTCGGSGTITFPGGCPVRQPDIDDGGALKNGNHQIHPQIKACP